MQNFTLAERPLATADSTEFCFYRSPNIPYLSNTPTNLCMALLNFSLFCFVLYCYAFVQYCNVKTIQYNAMHKFVGVLDNPQTYKVCIILRFIGDRPMKVLK